MSRRQIAARFDDQIAGAVEIAELLIRAADDEPSAVGLSAVVGDVHG